MGTTAEKLTYLNNTKQLLKENINNLGGNLTTEPFRQYASVLEGIYESLPKVSGIGASLSLSPSLMGKIKLNEIQGDTLQDGTPTPDTPVPIQSVTGLQNVEVCGKNLINGLLDNSTTGKKLERTINADENFYLYIKTNNTTSDRCYAFLDNTNVGTIWVSNNNGTLTFSGSRNFAFNRIRIQDNTTVSENMLTLGSTAQPYVPYKGNTYEVNLGNIELNKIGDYKDSIKKSTGKNLVYEIEQGSFNYQTGTFNTNANIIRTKKIPVKPNTTYTISSKLALGECCTYFYENDGTTGIAGSLLISTTTVKSISFTTPYNAYYMIFRLGASSVPYSATDDNNIMLNEGSTALPYEPYGKVWYVEKNIGKVVLDGSEEWTDQSVYDTTGYSRYRTIINTNTPYNNGYNNRFTQRVNQAHGSYEYLWLQSNTGALYLQLLSNRLSEVNLNGFKTWLASNNVEFIYILSTPEYTEITNTELINQLESLNNAKSEDGTTNINVTSEDLSMILNVGVLKGE